MQQTVAAEQTSTAPRKKDKQGKVQKITAGLLIFALIAAPQLALAQSTGSGVFDGITDFLRTIVNLVIFEWGKYIAILTLAWNAYRLKGGKISWLDFGGWLAGCLVLFFAPAIVNLIISKSSGSV